MKPLTQLILDCIWDSLDHYPFILQFVDGITITRPTGEKITHTELLDMTRIVREVLAGIQDPDELIWSFNRGKLASLEALIAIISSKILSRAA